jgi:hypothetical protein
LQLPLGPGIAPTSIRPVWAINSGSGNSGYRRNSWDATGQFKVFGQFTWGVTDGGGAEAVPALLRHEWRIVASARDPSLRPAKAARALIVNVGASSDPRRGGNSFSPCEVTPDKRLRAITDPDRWSVGTSAPICPITHTTTSKRDRTEVRTTSCCHHAAARNRRLSGRSPPLRLQLQAAGRTWHGMNVRLWWRPFCKPRLRATALQ